MEFGGDKRLAWNAELCWKAVQKQAQEWARLYLFSCLDAGQFGTRCGNLRPSGVRLPIALFPRVQPQDLCTCHSPYLWSSPLHHHPPVTLSDPSAPCQSRLSLWQPLVDPRGISCMSLLAIRIELVLLTDENLHEGRGLVLFLFSSVFPQPDSIVPAPPKDCLNYLIG